MRHDGFESQVWADHHHLWSNDILALFKSITPVFEQLTSQLYEAPWNVNVGKESIPATCPDVAR